MHAVKICGIFSGAARETETAAAFAALAAAGGAANN